MAALQAALLAGVGLQRLGLSELSGHLGLPYPQLLALFNKVHNHQSAVLRRQVWRESPVGNSQLQFSAAASNTSRVLPVYAHCSSKNKLM